MWIEKSDPKMFAEIQRRVKEGRWCLVGGWFIQPDCNIPSGESYARHALITQRYFLAKFGITAKTGYNVDSFGHNASIPMLLRNSRMENYVFMRPGPNEKTLSTHLFNWESRDGSSVMTYRIHKNIYCITSERMHLMDEISALDEGCDQMAFYGVGNHGGGPTVSLLDELHEKYKEGFVYSKPDSYFEAQRGKNIPTVMGDLQYHAKGCYSTAEVIKKSNRYSENALIRAEKMSVLSDKLMNTEYPQKELNYAWQRVLFNQFHDIMGGCTVREAVIDAEHLYGEVISIAERLTNFACQQISWNIDTINNPEYNGYVSEENAEKIGLPIVIFNPLPYSTITGAYVKSHIYNSAVDVNGREVAIQHVRDSKTDGNNKFGTLFEVNLPAFGYTVCNLLKAEPKTKYENEFEITDNSIANSEIKVTFCPSGEIGSIIMLKTGKELLSSPTSIALYNDKNNDTWAHGTQFFKDKLDVKFNGSFKITETGPVRASVRTIQTFGKSKITRDYYIYKSGRAVDVSVKIDYREEFSIMKLLFPVNNTEEKQAYCKIPFGYIERPTDGSEQVCGDWISLGILGVANDCKHSFEADGSVLSLTVLRSCLFADHYGQRDEYCEFMEQGEHFFKYRIFEYSDQAKAERNSDELQNPPTIVRETYHTGDMPRSFSGISVSEENLCITAIKKQEDGKGTVVRLFETIGKDTIATVRLFDTEFKCHIPHNSVKTYLVENDSVKEIDFIE